MHITSYDDFKETITASLNMRGSSRSALARHLESQGKLRAHTVRCLLGTPGTVIGKRQPSFDSALIIAEASGYQLCLVKIAPE